MEYWEHRCSIWLKNNTVHGTCPPLSLTPYHSFEHYIKKRQPFVGMHDCHEGVIIPGIYINIHGETVKIDPKSLDPNTEVMCF
jgi:hypothetical protein